MLHDLKNPSLAASYLPRLHSKRRQVVLYRRVLSGYTTNMPRVNRTLSVQVESATICLLSASTSAKSPRLDLTYHTRHLTSVSISLLSGRIRSTFEGVIMSIVYPCYYSSPVIVLFSLHVHYESELLCGRQSKSSVSKKLKDFSSLGLKVL